MSAPVSRSLIVNAEHFGRSGSINDGIIRAHEEGVVTSASLMVRHPAARQAAQYVHAHAALDVGLQMDFGEWRYVDGTWLQVYEVVPPGDREALAREARTQLAMFEDLVGARPSHLNCHQNAHRREPLKSVLLDLARELRVPLRDFSPAITYCGAFYGQTSKGYPYPQGITTERLIQIVHTLLQGVTELSCHPALRHDATDPYGAERVAELRTLTDPGIRPALGNAGIGLTRFRDVAGTADAADAPGPPGLLDKAIQEFRRGRPDEARAWLASAVRIQPGEPRNWLWLSRVQLKLGLIPDALESAGAAIDLRPGWLEARRHLQTIVGTHAPEVRAAVDACCQSSNGAAHSRRLMKSLFRTGHYREALELSGQLLRRAADEDAIVICAAARYRLHGNHNPEPALSADARVRYLLELDDAEGAWRQIQKRNAASISNDLLLQVAQALWARGALTPACEAFAMAERRARDNGIVSEWHQTAQAETSVLQGEWHGPAVSTRFTPIPGRILHIVGSALPFVETGYTLRTHAIAVAQKAAGLDVHVVTPLGFPHDHGFQPPVPEEDIEGVRYHRIPMTAGVPARADERLTRNCLQLAELVTRLRPSIVHAASDYRNALIALWAGQTFGLPVIYEVRGFWEDSWVARECPDGVRSERYTLWRAREHRCMRAADAVVTLSEVMKQALVARGIDEHTVHVIPNGADDTRFRPGPPDASLLRQLGIPAGSIVIGCTTTLSAYEGLDLLLQAAARLIGKGLAVHVLIAGDGEERHNLEAVADALGIRHRTVFTGWIPRAGVQRYHRLLDIYTIPRRPESVSQLVSPLKPFEAMASGLPLVVSDTEALGAVIRESGGGVTCAAGDPAALAAALESLIRDPGLRHSLGRSGREWVVRNRTWRAAGELYRSLYEALELREHVMQEAQIQRCMP